jgi:hypothetical protein
MLDEFHTALMEGGAPVERSVYDGGTRYIARHLAREITQSRWGVAEARKRVNTDDELVRTAVELLAKAGTPQQLFAVATAYAAAMPRGPEDPR